MQAFDNAGCLEMQDHRVHVSQSDFVTITRNGALCNAQGGIGAKEFETIIRGQVRHTEGGIISGTIIFRHHPGHGLFQEDCKF
jgi:hypothetical protein